MIQAGNLMEGKMKYKIVVGAVIAITVDSYSMMPQSASLLAGEQQYKPLDRPLNLMHIDDLPTSSAVGDIMCAVDNVDLGHSQNPARTPGPYVQERGIHRKVLIPGVGPSIRKPAHQELERDDGALQVQPPIFTEPNPGVGTDRVRREVRASCARPPDHKAYSAKAKKGVYAPPYTLPTELTEPSDKIVSGYVTTAKPANEIISTSPAGRAPATAAKSVFYTENRTSPLGSAPPITSARQSDEIQVIIPTKSIEIIEASREGIGTQSGGPRATPHRSLSDVWPSPHHSPTMSKEPTDRVWTGTGIGTPSKSQMEPRHRSQSDAWSSLLPSPTVRRATFSMTAARSQSNSATTFNQSMPFISDTSTAIWDMLFERTEYIIIAAGGVTLVATLIVICSCCKCNDSSIPAKSTICQPLNPYEDVEWI
jgi:hypothetical protein